MRSLNIIIISLLATISLGLINLSDSSNVAKEIEKEIKEKNFYNNASTKVLFIDRGVMTASWYGLTFNGKPTANGEIYNENELTAAHKTLPFGTILRVTNLQNNKVVYVRINDRGPYVEGRSLDLSKSSALALGMIYKGVIKAKIEEMFIPSQESPINSLN